MSARSARRPVPALVFLLALAVLAVVVWVRVADRDSAADEGSGNASCASAPQLPANAAVTVTVLNGAGKDGLASGTLDAFVAAGFARGNYDNATTTPGVAVVTAGPNGGRGALLVSYFLPGSTITTDSRGDTSVTVTLGQKFTALANAATVKAAMAKAMVSQSVPAPKTTAAATKPGTSKSAGSASPSPTCTTTPPVPTPAATGAGSATPGS